MYVIPSSGHISLNFNMPFKLILKGGLRLFSDVWSENAAFFEDWWKFIHIHQYYTMALKDYHLSVMCVILWTSLLWVSGNSIGWLILLTWTISSKAFLHHKNTPSMIMLKTDPYLGKSMLWKIEMTPTKWSKLHKNDNSLSEKVDSWLGL